MNRWGIPKWLEEEVKARDKTCVYCGVQLREVVPCGGSRKNMVTWEHIINDISIVTCENIARCCAACNSSKGQSNSLNGYTRVTVRRMVLAKIRLSK